MRAAASGRHVLCEKPLGLNLLEANQMRAACSQANVAFGCGLMMRFHPHHRRVSELILAGDLGTPTYARAQLSCWYPPIAGAWRQDPHRSGGGALPDLAVHCIDVLEMILGQKVRAVSCRLASLVHDYPVEDTAVLLLEFAAGATATIDCLFNVPDQAVKNRLEVYGTKGALLAEGTLGQSQVGELCWIRNDGEAKYDAAQSERMDRDEGLIPLTSGSLYCSMIEDFGAAITEGRPPFASGEQGLWLQRILDASQLAARERRTVDVAVPSNSDHGVGLGN
jgi:predicted dehydrogenase